MYSNPRSAGCRHSKSMMTPPSFKPQTIPRLSQSYSYKMSTEWLGASMWSSRSMEPPTSSRVPQGPDSLDPGPEPVSQPEPDFTADMFDTHWSYETMKTPQNPERNFWLGFVRPGETDFLQVNQPCGSW